MRAVIRRNRLPLLILAGLIAAIGFAAYVRVARLYIQREQYELAAAEAAWANQPIPRYELRTQSDIYCTQITLVENETIVERDFEAGRISGGQQTVCPDAPGTVTELFAFARRQIESYAENEQCGPNGCKCDGPVAAEVDYDETNRYPIDIRVGPLHQESWRYQDMAELMRLQPVNCTLIGSLALRVTITLTPLD